MRSNFYEILLSSNLSFYNIIVILIVIGASFPCNSEPKLERFTRSFNHQRGSYAVIRNQRCGLVLDASEYEVKLQHFTGFASQLWALELLDNGKFLIINKGNGKVLDIQGGAKNGSNIITYYRHDGVNQQWFVNSDNTIVSANKNLAIDLPHERPGGNVIAYEKHGGPNQQFHFQYQ